MDDRTLLEIEALKLDALGMLVENVGRLVEAGQHAPFGSESVSAIASRIRSLDARSKPTRTREIPEELKALVQLLSAWVHAPKGRDSFDADQLGGAYMMLPSAILRACGIEDK
jgi:hypothetical protein